MLKLITLITLLSHAFAFSGTPKNGSSGNSSFIILDFGVGHRSHGVPRWGTSIRKLSTSGTNASMILYFPGNREESPGVVSPIGAAGLVYARRSNKLYAIAGSEILETTLNGSPPKRVLAESDSMRSLYLAEKEEKVYYGTLSEGLIKRANLDGSNIEVVRNVSEGYRAKSMVPAYAYADGLLVDEEKGWIYWSATYGNGSGSVRRAPLNVPGKETILAHDVDQPGQLRLNGDNLYWVEQGRWTSSATSIKRFDLKQLRKSPPEGTFTEPVKFQIDTVVLSSQDELFFENDYTGVRQTLNIRSFVVSEDEKRVWFVAEDDGRTMFGKLVGLTILEDGSTKLEVLNADTKDVGIPVGLELVP